MVEIEKWQKLGDVVAKNWLAFALGIMLGIAGTSGMYEKFLMPHAKGKVTELNTEPSTNHLNTPSTRRADRRIDPLVVLMDSAIPSLVYDETTRQGGGSNIDDLTDALKDLPLMLVAETTSPAWSRAQQVLDLAPDVVIIHVSGFYSETAPMDPEEKFRSFLRLLAGSDTKFLVYSRGLWRNEVTSQDRERWQERLHFLEGDTFRDRLTFFQVEGGANASFRDQKTILDLQFAVKQLLDLS